MSYTKTDHGNGIALFIGRYGQYWRFFRSGRTVSKICVCGGTREITKFDGQMVTRCRKCKKYRY